MDIKIAVFASGSGSNAEQLIKHFQGVSEMTVSQVYCNKRNAFVLERAKNLDVPSLVFSRSEFKSQEFLAQLESVDFIILAGFLWKIPEYLIQAFPDKIINIHPALLPSYGGKGMYGSHVHESVIANKEKQSGITIHLVNENYDEGRTLFQASCDITSEDTPNSLAQKIHQLEHKYFPQIAEDYIREYMSKK